MKPPMAATLATMNLDDRLAKVVVSYPMRHSPYSDRYDSNVVLRNNNRRPMHRAHRTFGLPSDRDAPRPTDAACCLENL